MLHRLDKYLADVVLVAVEQPSDPQRGIRTELGDHLAGKLRVHLRLGRLLTQPGDDGNAVVPINQK